MSACSRFKLDVRLKPAKESLFRVHLKPRLVGFALVACIHSVMSTRFVFAAAAPAKLHSSSLVGQVRCDPGALSFNALCSNVVIAAVCCDLACAPTTLWLALGASQRERCHLQHRHVCLLRPLACFQYLRHGCCKGVRFRALAS